MPIVRTWGLLLAASVLLCGCAHGTKSPVDSNLDAYQAFMDLHPQWQLSAGPSGVQIDPIRDSQTARQQPLFYFDPAFRMHTGDLTLRSFRFTPEGDLTVTYAFRHPFAAPDFTKPPTGANRGDLSFAGNLLILADLKPGQVAAHTFFGNIVTSPEAIVDPDGFLTPTDVMYRPTADHANTFPYKLLVDEALDNREGVSNNGNSRGNYDLALGGWQRANIGDPTGNVGWTGFDYLHQGQTAVNSFTIRRQVLTQPGGFRCKLAVVIKYPDPKGVSPQLDPSVRFPDSAPVDVFHFSYREPYCALDVSKVEASPLSGDLSTAIGSQSTLDLAIRDWDAKAPVTTISNIGFDPNIGTVQPGSTGYPTVEVHIPGLSSAWISAQATNDATGLPEDPLRFRVTLANQLGTAPAGPVIGLIRITDPEALLPNLSTYTFGVDSETLETKHQYIKPVVYQAVVIDLPTG